MGMGDRPPSYSASNSMVIFLPPTSQQLPNPLLSYLPNYYQVVTPDPLMSVGPSFRRQKGGEGARAERNLAVGFKALELVSSLKVFCFVLHQTGDF